MGTANFVFYHDEPLFGLDIGTTSMKVMQIDHHGGKPKVIGYGVSGTYAAGTLRNGEIVGHEVLAKKLKELFAKNLVGGISTRRVVCTIPASHTFSRLVGLPPLDKTELAEAVELEAEQYIPVARENLYLDYEILSSGPQGVSLQVVAVPKNIIDSQMKFLEMVGLEPVAMEPTMNAIARLFGLADPSHARPSILVDFGAAAIDIAVFDKAIAVNSTVGGGGQDLTELISRRIKVGLPEAEATKTRYGLGVSNRQPEVMAAVRPIVENLAREIQKIIRYYEGRAAQKLKVSQIITVGGGANLVGLNQYLTHELNLPVRLLGPWQELDFGHLAQPPDLAKALYVTVAGAAILEPKRIFV